MCRELIVDVARWRFLCVRLGNVRLETIFRLPKRHRSTYIAIASHGKWYLTHESTLPSFLNLFHGGSLKASYIRA
jgi:hypothetical protein